MRSYDFLLFDADNTLFDFTAGSRIAFASAMDACGLPRGEATFGIYEAINLSFWKAFERGEIPKEAIYPGRLAALADAIGHPVPAEAFDRVYKKALGEQALLIPGAEELIPRLRNEGFRLFIITNGDTGVQQARFVRSPLTPYFESIFISEQIGTAKPSPAFFAAVASSINGFDPRRALIVGDSPSSDIRGAMNAGWDSVYFDRDGQPLPAGITANYTIHALTELYPILGLS